MESQLHRHYPHQEDPQSIEQHSGEGEQEQHGEKKSVLKKVKDKAKKIKDTIKKHGHGHGHEGGHNEQEGYEEDEDDEEENDVVNDPEVHGAPIYESTVIRSRYLPKEHDLNVEKPTDMHGGDTFDQNQGVDALTRPSEEAKAKIGLQKGLEEDPHSPNNSPAGLSPSNYQSKVAELTSIGGKEAEVTPLVREFGNLNVRDASALKPESAPQPVPTKNQFNPEANPVDTAENQEPNMKTEDPAVPKDIPQDTITGKISSATSAIANKAKNVVASKLGYGGDSGQEHEDFSKKSASESSATGYAHKVAEKLAPVYGKVAGVGSAAMSKVHGQGSDTGAEGGADKGVSMREYMAEKFKPGDEDKALSEVITNAFHKKKEEKKEESPMGKVTESEEVAARLGRAADNKREGDDALTAGSESSGQGVMDRLKDAVGSWLGKSTGIQTAQESAGRSFVSDAGSGSTGVGPREEGHVQPTNQTKTA